jgi:sugar-specific transcriptional regulator TrmB
MPSEPRDEPSLSKDLQELGFTDYEARIYIALLQESPVTAYEISKRNGLPRPNVYSALEGLERKQAVQRVSHEPVRFVPVQPKDLLDRISRNVVDRCSSLRTRLEEVKGVEQVQHVWSVRGAQDARAKIDELISGAQRHVWIKAHHLELEPHLDALRSAAERGVSILLVLFGTREDMERFRLPAATVYAHEGDGTIVGLGRYLITLTVDFEQALIVNMKEQSGAYTQSAPVVNMADSLIRHEIYLAEIFERLGDELDRQFGPALLALRKKYLPRDQAKALEQRVKARSR